MSAYSRTEFLKRSAAGAALLGGSGLLARAAQAAPRAAALESLTLQSAWVNDFEFLGYFVAMSKGYYQAAGIDLKYLPGGPSVIPESSLLSNKAQVALTSPDTTIKAIAHDSAPFVIIGAQFQKNPLGVVSLAKNPIRTPKELIGKTLAVPPVNNLSVKAMLKANGIDPAKVKIVPYSYDPTPLLKGNIDATVDFTDDMPFTLEQKGQKAVSFLLYDVGYPLFNDTVVVTKDTLAKHRDLLVKFLRASRKGWVENLKDPKAYPVKLSGSYFKGNGRTTANEVFSNTAQKRLMTSPHGIFSMSEQAIAANLKALEKIGIKGDRKMFDTTLLAEI
jgi:ABC-type nitrate/sulfonate/bicarbonate transport system substrate-binding protein